MRSPILEKLKQGTQASHEQASLHMAISFTLSLREYSLLLQRLWGFYTPLERQISQTLATSLESLNFERRKKRELLEQDLYILNFPISTQLSVCTELPELSNIGQVLGCLYVIEGATLGGQIISRCVKQHLGLDQNRGCSYFCSYGREIGSMWMDFCRILTEYASDQHCEEQILLSACTTFDAFNAWLQERKVEDDRTEKV